MKVGKEKKIVVERQPHGPPQCMEEDHLMDHASMSAAIDMTSCSTKRFPTKPRGSIDTCYLLLQDLSEEYRWYPDHFNVAAEWTRRVPLVWLQKHRR